MPVLSIIIPIYNTPVDALQRCFDSIDSLGDTDYEVLLIDDGSKPPVGEFCRSFVKEHPAFVYQYKENGGVSSARNLGITKATGDHITFLDADDIIIGMPIAKALRDTDCDLVILDTLVTEKEKDSVWTAFDRESGPISTETVLEVLLTSHLLNGPYAKLYKRDLIRKNNVRFDQLFVTGEDWDFASRFVLCCSTIVYLKESAYRYFRDGGNAKSRVNRFPDTMLDNTISMYEKKAAIVADRFCPEKQPALMSAASTILIENLFNTAADLMLLKKLTPERKRRLLEASAKARTCLLPESSEKTKIKAWILAHCFGAVRPLAHLREIYLKYKK